jgi:hypothetical protein
MVRTAFAVVAAAVAAATTGAKLAGFTGPAALANLLTLVAR